MISAGSWAQVPCALQDELLKLCTQHSLPGHFECNFKDSHPAAQAKSSEIEKHIYSSPVVISKAFTLQTQLLSSWPCVFSAAAAGL